MKKFLKSLTPPIIWNLVKKIRQNKYGWQGEYATWQEAQNTSTGYDADEILQKVKHALLKVKHGEAVYERDSVLFDEIEYSWPLLAGLMLASAKSCGKLNVVDFGGSLGSTYYQNKKFLDMFDDMSWNIVEQKHFVKIGKDTFQDNRLHFYYTIEECMTEERPTILLLSSVLQYIESPYGLLDEILEYDFEYILIDRTPFTNVGDDRVTIQKVPPSIYKASYPCWFFSEDKMHEYFTKKDYRLIENFQSNDAEGMNYRFKGMIWSKNVKKT